MLLGVTRHMWSAEIDGDCYRILVDYFSFDVGLIDYCDGILAFDHAREKLMNFDDRNDVTIKIPLSNLDYLGESSLLYSASQTHTIKRTRRSQKPPETVFRNWCQKSTDKPSEVRIVCQKEFKRDV
uniref:Uncharacterized protein n=1 Tax=Vespula pensylvanica TaxID=30213 RepID=A0A834KCP8_VESPE|nr:hypothetical protein H0235_014819 [Vespula pensylvanica]